MSPKFNHKCLYKRKMGISEEDVGDIMEAEVGAMSQGRQEAPRS